MNPPVARFAPRFGVAAAVRCWQRVLLAMLLSSLAVAAVSVELPKALAPRASAAPAASEPGSVPLTVDDWRNRLAQARAAHERLMAQPEGRAPLLADRQLASTRLLALLAAQVESAVEAAAEVQHPAKPVATPRLAGPGPYSAVEVDALRDQLDDLSARRDALRLSLSSLESELRAAIDNRSSANAALNLQRDRASRPLGGDDPALAQAQVELATLKAQTAGLEVLQAERSRQQAQARLAALDEPIAQLAREVERVRRLQRLDPATLDLKLKELDAEERTLATERTRLEDRIAQRSQPAADLGTLRGRELEALRSTVNVLRELQTLVHRQANGWRGRPDLLADDKSADDRRAMAAALAGALDETAARQRSVADRAALLRIEMRALGNGAAARGDEQRLQEAQQLHMTALQRLEESLRRTAVLLSRMRDDLAAREPPSGPQGWFERGWEGVSDGLRALWQKEIFSATETTVVDGQRVTLEHGVTVGKSVGLLALLIVGYWAVGVLARQIARLLEQRLQVSAQFASVLRRWINSILMIAVVLIVLRLAHIPLTAFAFLGGALAIGVGFGTQNIIKNLISGVIILLERKIQVGDVVTVGGMSGTVVTVDFRATTVRGFDGVDSIVPNSQLLENQISNWSGGGPSVRRIVAVGVAYGCDVRRAAELVATSAREHRSVLPVPAPEVLLHDFGSDALVLRLLYWTRLGGERGGPTVDSDLRFAIEQALREAGIAIAFPQRDVHLDLAGPVPVQVVGPGQPAAPAAG